MSEYLWTAFLLGALCGAIMLELTQALAKWLARKSFEKTWGKDKK